MQCDACDSLIFPPDPNPQQILSKSPTPCLMWPPSSADTASDMTQLVLGWALNSAHLRTNTLA